MSNKAGHHRDAVHRAGRQAQFAAGAFLRNDGVHALARAENGVDRADIQAFAAADAGVLFNNGDGAWFVLTELWIERLGGGVQQRGKRLYSHFVSRRALIDTGFARGHGLGIGAATWIATLCALGLWQPGIDFFHGGVMWGVFRHGAKYGRALRWWQ
jgi:hypothetical protein